MPPLAGRRQVLNHAAYDAYKRRFKHRSPIVTDISTAVSCSARIDVYPDELAADITIDVRNRCALQASVKCRSIRM